MKPQYSSWKVRRVEKVVKEERVTATSFEIVVANGRKAMELVFDKDGVLLREEARMSNERDW